MGDWTDRGDFLGEVIRFSGEEAGHWREYHGRTGNSDDMGTDFTLYRCGEDAFRVHVHNWSRWQGSCDYASLHPNSGEYDPYAGDPEYGPHTLHNIHRVRGA